MTSCYSAGLHYARVQLHLSATEPSNCIHYSKALRSKRFVIDFTRIDALALDTNAPLPSLNNLTSLTYLTATSPQIREVLTADGGLERLLDILRDSTLPRPTPISPPDIWGFNGPPSARAISLEQQIALRHSLAFQCVVNIGVRGTEAIRTRVVQAGTLDLVAQMLESWLIAKGVYIYASGLGSTLAVEAEAAGRPYGERRRSRASRHHESGHGHSSRRHRQQSEDQFAELVEALPPAQHALGIQQQHLLFGHAIMSQPLTESNQHSIGQRPDRPTETAQMLMTPAEIEHMRSVSHRARHLAQPRAVAPQQTEDLHRTAQPEGERRRRGTVTRANRNPAVNEEVEMEAAEERELTPPARPATGGGDRPMQIDDTPEPSRVNLASSLDSSSSVFRDRGDVGIGSSTGPFSQSPVIPNAPNPNANPSITPRARQGQLPMAIPIPVHPGVFHDLADDTESRVSSAGNSFSGVEDETFATALEIPRASSSASGSSSATANESIMLDRELNETVVPGPSRRHLAQSLVGRIPQLIETDGPVSNQSSPMGTPTRGINSDGIQLRRDTITARPAMGIGMFAPTRNAEGRRERMPTGGSGTSAGEEGEDEPQRREPAGPVVPQAAEENLDVEILRQDVEPQAIEDNDADALAAAQAAQDLFDGAPPGQPGTGVNAVLDAQTPRPPHITNLVPATAPQAQVITATGAPRGFPDLATFLTQRMDEPQAEHEYGDSTVLVALQLLAYLSKYPHVRAVFYHPHRPMHPTFDYDINGAASNLPSRPASSQTPNIFCLVERFRFRPTPCDPHMFDIPPDIQYWAGVIMRNACRKDEKRGGLRQCANMSCGIWETLPREFAKCRRCRKAKYCSKECQSQAWSEGHRFW